MEEYIEANAKLYKNLADIRVSNISEINSALDKVADFIKTRKRILYGGMAIDFALKSNGFEGIYDSMILPDYDFYSPENVIDSLVLVDYLRKAGLEEAEAINGLHLTTRRVRLDKATYVADLSYYPEPYYSRIRIGTYNKFVFVHPDFQRIDLHLSLSYLYGLPGYENFRNRLDKDIKRFNMINKDLPFSSESYVKVPETNIWKGLMMETLNSPCEINLGKLPSDVCIAGFAALEIALRVCGLSKNTNMKIDSPDYLEVFTDSIKNYPVDIKYDKSCDILPEAGVCHKTSIIYYDNYGRLLSACKTKYGPIANVHYLSASFLFKYFMLGEKHYLDAYNKCLKLIEISDKKGMPNSIDGYYYGRTQLSEPMLYSNKSETCTYEGKEINFRPRIMAGTKHSDIKVETFITYNIRGQEIGEYIDKSFNCTL